MKTAAGSAPLDGVGVLITRPEHQAEQLCQLIERWGGSAFRFPVLEIADPVDAGPLRDTARRLEHFDYAVFISANAVNRALEQILAIRDWPATLAIAVVGRASAGALQHFGLSADVCPAHKFNSEALLELPELRHVRGKRFVIFRGDVGREFLAETLRQRGAEVEYVQAYRRLRPHADISGLLRSWRAGEIDIVLVNSAESLTNLAAMLGEQGKPLLTATQLLVASDRILPLARKLGFRHQPVVAENATDRAMLDALLDWQERHG